MNPILRFNDFESDYVNGCINDVTVSLSSGVSVNSYDISVESSEEYGVLKTSCISNGVFNNSENKKIIDSDIKRAKNPVKKNTIIVSRMNTPILVGEIGYIDKSYENLFVPDRLWVLSCNQESDAKWLTYCLVSQRVKAAIKNRATGTSASMKNISKPSFLNVKISIPPQLGEQQKIADFLSSVDKKIALLKEKHDLLAQYKKGVMQKLFSQEIRFKDEAGNDFPDWEEDRLDSFVVKVSDPVKVDPDETYREIGVRSHAKGVFHKKPIKGHELGNKRVFWAHPKAFIVNIVFAWEHAVALTSDSETGFIASHRFPMFVPKEDRVDLRYFTIFFKSKRGKHLLGLASPGGAGRNKTLGQSNFAELKLTIPCLEEQARIADFYESLDNKEKLVAQQIEHTQTFKKGLLQQMFV